MLLVVFPSQRNCTCKYKRNVWGYKFLTVVVVPLVGFEKEKIPFFTFTFLEGKKLSCEYWWMSNKVMLCVTTFRIFFQNSFVGLPVELLRMLGGWSIYINPQLAAWAPTSTSAVNCFDHSAAPRLAIRAYSSRRTPPSGAACSLQLIKYTTFLVALSVQILSPNCSTARWNCAPDSIRTYRSLCTLNV